MTHYLLRDYDKEILEGFLINNGKSELSNPHYFIAGSPITINREKRIIESYDEGSLRLLASMHEREKEVIVLD